ncbi:MAG: ferrochelatase, partial [Halobacteriovoraceae bacterium]|nr:ferrochelatase [Halobacteriovoraceae bacterium]
MSQKRKIILVGLGSPKSPAVGDVRKYLREFLSDPHVVDANPFLWKIILNLFVLPTRPKSSAELYKRIWDGKEFPLIKYTRGLAEKVAKALENMEVEVVEAYVLSSPRLVDYADDIREGALVVPLFPQYSDSTIGSIKGVIEDHLGISKYNIVESWYNSKAFIDNSVNQINSFLDDAEEVDCLLLSFHGLPKRWVLYKGDPYYRHCCETFYLIKNRLKTQLPVEMVFQSRFGSDEWLTPYTDERVVEIINSGKKKIAVYCPAFVTDCLETVDEIGHELNNTAKEVGGSIEFIPCLNDSDQFSADLSQYLLKKIEGEDGEICPISELENIKMPE